MFNREHFKKAKKFWYQGKFCSWEKPTVHSMAHALHYGTSVFEGIRAYPTSKGPSVFRLREHVDRFFHSASVLEMKLPYSKEEVITAILETVKENKLNSAYIRPMAFYSYGSLALDPRECLVEVVIAAWEWELYLGDKVAQQGAKALILPWKRFHHSQIVTSAKVGGLYAQSQMGAIYAHKRGFDEGIFLNLEGNIAEGAGENIFIIKNKVIKTNDAGESILEGITQKSIIEIAKNLGFPVEIGKITKEELFAADEAFFTGTATEIAPLTRIRDDSFSKTGKSDYVIGDGQTGKITSQLSQAYKEVVGGKTSNYEQWLTYIP